MYVRIFKLVIGSNFATVLNFFQKGLLWLVRFVTTVLRREIQTPYALRGYPLSHVIVTLKTHLSCSLPFQLWNIHETRPSPVPSVTSSPSCSGHRTERHSNSFFSFRVSCWETVLCGCLIFLQVLQARHWVPLFEIIFTRMFVEWRVLKDRIKSLCSSMKICL